MLGYLRRLLPDSWVRARRRLRSRRIDRQFRGLTPEEAFTRIYHHRRWGRDEPFHSGWGSKDPRVVDGYIERVGTFLAELGHKPDVVDLGCGDFAVGARVRSFCAGFIACDVVGEVIERNRELYRDLHVEFRHMDLTRDPLPPGEVGFVRQVLQHLTNDQIGRFVANLHGSGYRFLLVTEEIPHRVGFVPNRDKPIGPGIRIGRAAPDSGVVLTAPPFDLTVRSERIIWDTPGQLGIIRTISYELV